MEVIYLKEIHKSNGRIRNKRMSLEIRVVPADAYPDLMDNPTNEYMTMTDDERLKDFIETMGQILADTQAEKKSEKKCI